MKLLGEHQGRVIPQIGRHGGSVDKFLGDGSLASFGAVTPSQAYAADTQRMVDAIVDEFRCWQAERRVAGVAVPEVGVALACGAVLFGHRGRREPSRMNDHRRRGEYGGQAREAERVGAGGRSGQSGTCELGVAQGNARHRRARSAKQGVEVIGVPIDLVVLAR
ncbi:MAG: hypothetical protein AB7I59_02630 [Geminicoccaceae bacterium]